MAFWQRKKKAPQYDNITLPIEYAFSVNGTDYWMFTDPFNLPPVRALKAVTFFEEARMRCSSEYLQKHADTVADLLSQPKIDIFKIKVLNDQLKDRIAWKMPELELLYKVASVVFFDMTEHPANYDFAYNQKKIEGWKKHAEPGIDFFLRMPLRTLMPFLSEQPENLQIYSQVVEELNQMDLENLYSISATLQKQNSLNK